MRTMRRSEERAMRNADYGLKRLYEAHQAMVHARGELRDLWNLAKTDEGRTELSAQIGTLQTLIKKVGENLVLDAAAFARDFNDPSWTRTAEDAVAGR